MIIDIHKMKELMTMIPKSYTWGLTSGGYDPIHPGHISCLQEAAKACDNLIVIVNGDDFLNKKKGKPFMPLKDRCYIVDSLRGINYVVPFTPTNPNDMTVCEAIEVLRPHVFIKGGDRIDKTTIPEWTTCERLGIMIMTGVGDDKIWSSSDYLKDWVEYKKGV